jgi:hypothetical protein
MSVRARSKQSKTFNVTGRGRHVEPATKLCRCPLFPVAHDARWHTEPSGKTPRHNGPRPGQ